MAAASRRSSSDLHHISFGAGLRALPSGSMGDYCEVSVERDWCGGNWDDFRGKFIGFEQTRLGVKNGIW
jgi:hypothetical protein